MRSLTLTSGQSIRMPVLAGDRLLVSPRAGQFTAAVVAGIAGMPVSLAAASTAVSTFGPWAAAVEVRISAHAGAVVDFDIDAAPSIDRGDLPDFGVGVGPGGVLVGSDGKPVAGAVITQPTRNSNFPLLPADSGTVIPVTGNVTATVNAASLLTAPVEILRMDAGTLGAVASGASLIDRTTGLAWGTLQVTKKFASLLIFPTPTAGEYAASKDGA